MFLRRLALLGCILPLLLFALVAGYERYQATQLGNYVNSITPIQDELVRLSIALGEVRGLRLLSRRSDEGSEAPLRAARVALQAHIEQLSSVSLKTRLDTSWLSIVHRIATAEGTDKPELAEFFAYSAAIEQSIELSQMLLNEWALAEAASEKVLIAHQLANQVSTRIIHYAGQVRALSSIPELALVNTIRADAAVIEIDRARDILLGLADAGSPPPPVLLSQLDELVELLSRLRAFEGHGLAKFELGTLARDKAVQFTMQAQVFAEELRLSTEARSARADYLVIASSLLSILVLFFLYRYIIAKEEEAHVASERLMLATHAIKLGVWIRNLKTEEMYFSPELRDMLGVGDEEVLQPMGQYVSTQDEEIAQKLTDELMAEPVNSKPHVAEARLKRAHREERWARLHFAKTLINRTDQGVVGIVMDIHDEVQTRNQLDLAHDNLAARNAELQHFARSTAHDLLEPVRMMRSFAELLKEELPTTVLGGTTGQYLEYLLEGSERAQDTLANLQEYLALGAVNYGHVVSLDDALAGAMQILAGEIERSNAQVHHGALGYVRGNEQTTVGLLQNLLANAIKYQNPDNIPVIEVSVRNDQAFTHLKVTDNGIGVATDYLESVFEPFKRLHLRREYSGTGLGLAICKRSVEAMGGEIWLESDGHSGLTVHIRLLGVEI